MGTMPYWLAKTAEMMAMDQWFSLEDAGTETELIRRYQAAIQRVTTASDEVLTRDSSVLDGRLGGGSEAAVSAMRHFDTDWLNFDNPSSGGDFWPQIPTWSIIIWMRQGVLSAARKALGASFCSSQAEIQALFKYEIEVAPDDPRTKVLPLITCWICTTGPGTGGFEVDAVRGPTAVQLVISTPAPYQQSHIWPSVKAQIDAMWSSLHPNQAMPSPPAPPGSTQ